MIGTVPDTGVPENAATGADEREVTITYSIFVSLLLPALFVAVRETLYFPAAVYW